jgi:hypothetical protein
MKRPISSRTQQWGTTMSKRDDNKPDYDKNVLRFVGNCLASQNWATMGDLSLQILIDRAIYAAKYARAELRKEQQ